MNYVDGFVLVVQKKRISEYLKIARKASKIWKEYGALEYREAVGDDLAVSWGRPFGQLTKLKADETVVFAWIVYRSKGHRDSVNKKIMKDERLQKMCDPNNPPFDMKRMSYGGFKIKVKS